MSGLSGIRLLQINSTCWHFKQNEKKFEMFFQIIFWWIFNAEENKFAKYVDKFCFSFKFENVFVYLEMHWLDSRRIHKLFMIDATKNCIYGSVFLKMFCFVGDVVCLYHDIVVLNKCSLILFRKLFISRLVFVNEKKLFLN